MIQSMQTGYNTLAFQSSLVKGILGLRQSWMGEYSPKPSKRFQPWSWLLNWIGKGMYTFDLLCFSLGVLTMPIVDFTLAFSVKCGCDCSRCCQRFDDALMSIICMLTVFRSLVCCITPARSDMFDEVAGGWAVMAVEEVLTFVSAGIRGTLEDMHLPPTDIHNVWGGLVECIHWRGPLLHHVF